MIKGIYIYICDFLLVPKAKKCFSIENILLKNDFSKNII
jgi:hypothetical protein